MSGWYKVYADGTELDVVHAENKHEAIEIVKSRILTVNSDITFTGISWSTKQV